MGGAASTFKSMAKGVGLGMKAARSGGTLEITPKAPTPPSPEVVEQRERAETDLSRRRARRGGRALLSEARLAPEQGVTTLGNTGV
jgi:hypothetical protein